MSNVDLFIKELTKIMGEECIKFFYVNGNNGNDGRTFTMRQILDYCNIIRKEMTE